MSASDNLTKIQDSARRLSNLLDQGETGIASWHMAIHDNFERLAADYYGVTVEEWQTIIRMGRLK